MAPPGPKPPNALTARRLGLDTQDEAMVFVRSDSPVCRSEGFSAHSRVQLTNGTRSIIATLYQTSTNLVSDHEIGLSEAAWRLLGLVEGGQISVSHPAPLESLKMVRGKVFGQRLDDASTRAIISDIVAGRYSDIHLSSFVTACSALPLDLAETIALTRAMVDTGSRITWGHAPIADKHCVGGLPGNRTTPVIVAICASLGLTIPKTSSRAITSPAGTADTMEVLTDVDLDLESMRQVVDQEGGCFIWGGGVQFSPADDALIRIERALDLDSEGALVASVLSKKIAAGATHVVIDIPVGPTAKVRSLSAASSLQSLIEKVASEFGLAVLALVTDGTQPVGRGIGPALEARDVLQVLRNDPDAPADLADRACLIAGALLELTGKAPSGTGKAMALNALRTGTAYSKFESICRAQGGFRPPVLAEHYRPFLAPAPGRVASIDNRRLARVAKLAGAPGDKAAGVDLHVRLGDTVKAGQALYTLYTQTPGELAYAIDYVTANPDIIELTRP
ncbi:MAG: thymidine phosphorylase [Hyphomonas sp. BRH_c22]|uniref:thymidine phosphorylase family protein n=1 Tax=Hyphomonas sp. BRH_c22 TaxID=1629710 RepID=UPI0005F25251|nr:thymidine phosphorylase family protein [Hyphomonas sp. BRH_c22]KJS38206.1 MAG: thymidine phosphorylase [Hyphomonas sp. BRH_c22]